MHSHTSKVMAQYYHSPITVNTRNRGTEITYHFSGRHYNSTLSTLYRCPNVPENVYTFQNCNFLNQNLRLKDHPAESHLPSKHIPGWNIVIASIAKITDGPSSTMNNASLFAKAPPKPPESSTTRYTDRIKIAIVDTAKAKQDVSLSLQLRLSTTGTCDAPYLNARNAPRHLSSAKASSLGACTTCHANSRQRYMNKAKLRTWKARPATMMRTPTSELALLAAVDAMPPPIDCRSNDAKSQLMKVIVYVRGLNRENFVPYTNTSRARQR